MKKHILLSACALGALSLSSPVLAQSWGDDVTGGSDGGSESASRDSRSSGGTSSGERGVTISPYIEVSQVGVMELSPGDDTVTYTQVAAGVDASVQGRNNGGSVSIRYERNFGWGNNASDSDTVSGVARGYASIVPQAVTVEAGAMAARTTVDGTGSTTLSSLRQGDSESNIYSAYVGPNVHTRLGSVETNANYRFGYTRVESPDAIVTAPGGTPVDLFDESTTHNANVHFATRPGEPLPVGLGVGGGYYQEDINNLDQRVRDMYGRADVTVPVSQSLSVVAGVGYEDVEVSNRDAVRDVNGDPVIGTDGRLVTDTTSARQLSYDVSGLIWDVGVVWRPSSRTAFEAHVGKRYDSTTYYGSFAWAPNDRSALNISVYDGVSGFGGQLNNALAGLPTNFTANRNAINGDVTGCVNSLEGGNCLNGVLGSIRSATFRGRGVSATYSRRAGNLALTVGAGYDRRKFIAAAGTVLGAADGAVDETFWGAVNLDGKVGRRGSFSLGTYANYFTNGVTDESALAVGSQAAYSHNIYRGLSARAAVAYDFLDSDVSAEEIAAASALVGIRYDF
ncbi:MAG: preprotein translocase subunit YajC [Sphingomonadaceae bacterium]|nr:preprotein translocase subunit YajC [Sphingomonadaceae bacterium]